MDKQGTSVEKLLEINEKQQEIIEQLIQENRWLKEQFNLLRHKQFGSSSEKTDTNQICFFNEAEASADLSAPEPSLTEV